MPKTNPKPCPQAAVFRELADHIKAGCPGTFPVNCASRWSLGREAARYCPTGQEIADRHQVTPCTCPPVPEVA